MAFIRVRYVLLFAFLAAALVAVAYAKKKPVSRKILPVSSDSFNATLYSPLEIPENDTEAALNAIGDDYGWAKMGLIIHKKNGQPEWLEYGVAAGMLQAPGFHGVHFWNGMCPIIMTHVHKATWGSNGPKVLDLPCKYKSSDPSSYYPIWKCNGFLGKDLAERTAEFVSTLKEILKNPSGFYGNIHTLRYPNGAVRGQFEKVV